MYSVLLLAAATTGGAGPALHKARVPSNCNANVGHSWGSWGSGYGGCYGMGYTGWVNVGGSGHPHASTGGWGLPYSGDAGWGQAYSGAAPWGAGYGGYGFAPNAGGWPGWMGYGGCGGYAGFSYSGGALFGQPAKVVVPPGTVVPEGTAMSRQAGAAGRSARLVVTLPEGARLFVDDSEIEKPGTSRTFRSPALEKGEVYYYELRAEVERDGKVLTQKRRVVVSAGRTVTADFTNLVSATAIAAAKPR